MKLGVFVNFVNPNEIEGQLKNLYENGFGACQLACWNPDLFTDENATLINKCKEKYEIEISAFWCGWVGPCVWDFYDGQLSLGLVPPEYRATRIKNLCDGGDFAKKLGITDVITHMGFIPENPNDPNFNPFCLAVRTVAKHLEGNGQYLLFETGQETPVTMLRCFETVGTSNLGINLDTANLILYGRANPVDALDVFGKYVRNIHAKDGMYPTNGHDLGQETRLGEGKVDFEALFKRLKELNYDSHVTIEREITGPQQLVDILESKKYLTQIIEKIYESSVE